MNEITYKENNYNEGKGEKSKKRKPVNVNKKELWNIFDNEIELIN